MSRQPPKRPRRRSLAGWATVVLAALAVFAQAGPAHAARIVIGTEEELRHIQDVELKTRDGEALYLGFKLSFHWLGLPYAMTDDGYVLGVKGQNRYYTLDQNLLKEWQSQGYLPAELPRYTIRTEDYVFAHAMWIGLGLLGAWFGGRALMRRRVRPAAPAGAGAVATAVAAIAVVPDRIEPAPPAAESEVRIMPQQPQPQSQPQPQPVQSQVQPAAAAPPAAAMAMPGADIARMPVAKTVARVKVLK